MKENLRLLNVRDEATLSEIEEAYREQKRELSLSGLEQGSDDWLKVARMRQALDKAYYDVMAEKIFELDTAADGNPAGDGAPGGVEAAEKIQPPVQDAGAGEEQPRLHTQPPVPALSGETPGQDVSRKEKGDKKDKSRAEHSRKEKPQPAPVPPPPPSVPPPQATSPLKKSPSTEAPRPHSQPSPADGAPLAIPPAPQPRQVPPAPAAPPSAPGEPPRKVLPHVAPPSPLVTPPLRRNTEYPDSPPATPQPPVLPAAPPPGNHEAKPNKNAAGSKNSSRPGGIRVSWKYLVSQNIWQIIFIAAAFFITVVVSYFPIDDIMQKEIFASSAKDLQAAELRIRLAMLEDPPGYGGGDVGRAEMIFNQVGAFSALPESEGILLDEHLRVIGHSDRNLLGRHVSEIWDGVGDSGSLEYAGDSFSRMVTDGGVKKIVILRKIYSGWTVGFSAPISIFYRGITVPAVRLSAMGVIMCVLLNFILLRLSRDKIRSEEESKSKTAFLARMSHEIRTPMNAILGMSELALETEDREAVNNYINIISQAGRNLLAIINDILDFSKAESGGVDINPAPYRLSSMLTDVVSVVQVSLIDKPIVFAVDAAYELPENLVGDSTRVRQVLLNILSNASKYTHEGFIKLSISCEERGTAQTLLRFEVADSGMGIKREELGKIFDNFVRANSPRMSRIEGSGLGLAITKNLCRAMSGDIAVESVYGEGSVFTVTIPQIVQSGERMATVHNAREKRVLLLDNRPVYGDAVHSSLKSLTLQTTRVTDDDEFIGKLSSGRYHFAFVSPQMAGEAASCQRRSGAPTQVVLLAAMGENMSSKGLPVVLMPAFTISIANFLNGISGAAIQLPKVKGAPFTAPSARVLVVDDNLTNLKVAQGLLTKYRMQIDTCESGRDAIALAKAVRYDIIFMDHMMPEMDGIQATQALRAVKSCEKIPVIALTANAVVGMQEMFLKSGMDDFLPKPVDRAKLYAVLRKWLPAEKQRTASLQADPARGLPSANNMPLVPIDGFDLGRCLENCGNDRELFLDIIHAYIVNSRSLVTKLKGLEYNPGEYAIYAHGLKGSSYSICADKIGKMAEKLEMAAKKGETDVLRSDSARFISATEALLASLSALEDAVRKAQPEDLGEG